MSSRTPRQKDLERTLRAAKAVGLEVERLEVDPASGRFTIMMKGEAGAAKPNNPLDAWLATNARSS